MGTNSSTTEPTTVDIAAVLQLVDRAVRAAVPRTGGSRTSESTATRGWMRRSRSSPTPSATTGSGTPAGTRRACEPSNASEG